MGSSDAMSSTPPTAPRQYGKTKPISAAGPTEADLQRTKELEKIMPFILLLCLPSLLASSSIYMFIYRVFWCFMCKFLVDAGLYESKEEALKRLDVLGEIDKVERSNFSESTAG